MTTTTRAAAEPIDEQAALEALDLSRMQMPASFAWVFFVPGVIGVAVDICRLQITGVFLLGVVFLLLWAWLLGAFHPAFWAPVDPAVDAHYSAVDEQLDAEAAFYTEAHHHDGALCPCIDLGVSAKCPGTCHRANDRAAAAFLKSEVR